MFASSIQRSPDTKLLGVWLLTIGPPATFQSLPLNIFNLALAVSYQSWPLKGLVGALELEKFSSISGKTGIYVQYAQVRAKKILSKSMMVSEHKINQSELDDNDKNLLDILMNFEIHFKQALDNNEPHHLADYLYQISNLFNSMYQSENILENKNDFKKINKILITKYFVNYSLLLMESLGISPVDEM